METEEVKSQRSTTKEGAIGIGLQNKDKNRQDSEKNEERTNVNDEFEFTIDEDELLSLIDVSDADDDDYSSISSDPLSSSGYFSSHDPLPTYQSFAPASLLPVPLPSPTLVSSLAIDTRLFLIKPPPTIG